MWKNEYTASMIYPELADINNLKLVVQNAGIRLSPDKSQHFLVSAEVVQASLALVKTGPQALTELGAGVGTLTQALAHTGFKIRAIERDPAVAKLIPSFIPPKERSQIEVIIKDLRDVDWTYSEPYQVVGNIPYAFSGLIIRRLTQLDPAPTQAILLVQKEVGQRVVAQPGDMSLLSLAIQLWGTAHQVLDVPKSCFFPPPQVDSALIYIAPHSPEKYSLTKRESVLKIAKIFFQGKRKQIRGVLRKQFKDVDSGEVLQKVDLTAEQRPQELTAEQWVKLHAILASCPVV